MNLAFTRTLHFIHICNNTISSLNLRIHVLEVTHNNNFKLKMHFKSFIAMLKSSLHSYHNQYENTILTKNSHKRHSVHIKRATYT